MEKYIDLINAYLQKSLSESEILAFETKLQTDIEFNSIYKEHLVILKGISRMELKAEINDARQSYVRTKWLKYLGISIGIIIISFFAYNLITTSQNSKNQNSSENNTVEFVSDSIYKEQIEVVETVIDTISTEKVIPEKSIVDVINKNEKNNTKTSAGNNLISFFNSVKKQPQKIKVNTAEDFKITLKEGTIISIPKNAFLEEKTKKQVSGNIELSITEYYKLSDLLLANLTTKSNDKILETGGMLYIEARKNGLKLKLRPQSRMNIIFNSSGKQNMQLFKGEKDDSDEINWKLNAPEGTTSEVDDVIDTLTGRIENTVLTLNSVEEVPIYPNCEDGSNEERKNCMETAIKKLVSRKYDLSIAEDLNLSGNHTIRTSFEIDKEGNIGKIEARASHRKLAEEAIRVIELLPKLKPGKLKGEAVDVKYYFPIHIQLQGKTVDQSTSVTLKSDKGFIATFNKKSISDLNNSNIERYTLATSNLGWINCDRFVNSKKRKIKYKLKIKDSEGANVKMVFKSMSSILPSNKIDKNYSFGEIPIDEDVILFAIKKKDGKLFLGIKEVTTEMVSEIDLKFKEVSIKELKAELRILNTDFN